MRSEILSLVGLTDDEFLHDQKLVPELREKAGKLIREAHLPIDIIVGGFSGTHTIFLQIDGEKIVEQTSPGVFLGGSGSDAALHWLNFRQQNVYCSRARSYAHVLESMAFAKLSPNVGKNFGCILLRRGEGKPIHLSEAGENWAIECQKKIWLRPTTYLDTDAERESFDGEFGIKQSASQMSASAKLTI